jgi:putative ABC transport system permease protein
VRSSAATSRRRTTYASAAASRRKTQSGVKLNLTVRAIQKLPTFGPLLGAVTISTTLFDHSFLQPGDAVVLADTGGTSASRQRLLTGLLAGFPTAKVRTVDGFIKTSQATVNTLLNLFYVLLALSVIVSLFGIVNTLALSIVERTREIGALRAIGMTRRQLRRMITVESEITAMIGAILGIIVGLALAALATAALASWSLTFSVPVATLCILAISAFFAGIAAGILPARRAAHLDPLHALQYE